MIINKTTNEKINLKIKKADSFIKRLVGLMFKRNIDYGLLFTNISIPSIHTSFMRFEIDVYFLNKEKVVVDKTTLKSWKYYKTNKTSEYILETKKDQINVIIGDTLEFI